MVEAVSRAWGFADRPEEFLGRSVFNAHVKTWPSRRHKGIDVEANSPLEAALSMLTDVCMKVSSNTDGPFRHPDQRSKGFCEGVFSVQKRVNGAPSASNAALLCSMCCGRHRHRSVG